MSETEKENISEDVRDIDIDGSEKVPAQKTTEDGILLVPQPSDDPEQPLVTRDDDTK
jgi:hypothetical protein